MFRSVCTRASLVAVTGIVLAACAASPSSATPSVVAATPRPTIAASPTPTAAPASPASPTSGPTTFDSSTLDPAFALPMTVDLPADWRALFGNGGPDAAVAFVHLGDPPEDDSQWWGPDVWLVDGARVHDPADVVSDQPAKADAAKFVAWPADVTKYLSGLPGVTVVDGPEPVEVGGFSGTRVVLDTPAMHPWAWLKDDTTWMGGGREGVDRSGRRLVVSLDVHGQHVLLGFADAPDSFDARLPQVEQLLQRLSFPT